MAAQPRIPFTVQEYLALDRASDRRFEYIEGDIVLMAGASREHNIINNNLGGILYTQLRQRPCEVYTADMRVHISATDGYAYPDQVIVCGEPRFHAKTQPDTLLNPTVIIEVLSDTTADYDRGVKFENYRRIPSLQDYLLVSQTACHVVHYTRRPDDTWTLTETDRLDDTVDLPAIKCQLPLAEVYAKLDLAR